MDTSVGCGGLSDLKSHLTTGVHKSNAEACKTNQMLNTFYVSKKDDDMDRNNARAAAEVAKEARRQDSVTAGAEINFEGAREVYLCEFERGTGARQICPSLDQINTAKTKNLEGFSGRNQKFKRFRPKTVDLQKQKGLHPKNVMKSGVSPRKLQKYRWQTPIWASICTPVAPSPLISSGHSPRLEGHNFRLGGHKQSFGGARPRNAPPPWRRACG